MAEEAEAAECPVCLQPFDGESTIPRVLGCGHSTCHDCLVSLPKPPFIKNTIRCPGCTQLVFYPPQGPSALPKNIDLIRLSKPFLSIKPSKSSSSSTTHDFVPNLWSHEFYLHWKHRILPQLSIETSDQTSSFVLHQNHKSKVNVSLFKLAFFSDNDNDENAAAFFKFSYISKVMWLLFKLGNDDSLSELDSIFNLNHPLVSTAYGLWCDHRHNLYLVCEYKARDTSLLNVVVSQQEDLSTFGIIGMELCETVMKLHDYGLVCGCCSLSCFCIDRFGHIVIGLNQVYMVGERLQNMTAQAVSFAHDNSQSLESDFTNALFEIHAFPSPELLVEFVQKQGIHFEFDKSTCTAGYSSDVWSIACILIWFLVGKSFADETYAFLSSFIHEYINGNTCDCENLFVGWLDKVSGFLDNRLGSDHVSIKELLCKCLCHDPGTRPPVIDVWKYMRGLIIKPKFDIIAITEEKSTNTHKCHCLLLGDLLWSSKKTNKVDDRSSMMNDSTHENLVVESDVIEGLRKTSLACTELKGHLDCISGLAVGGGFLFSSSFDKTVEVWSLQGFNHVHTLKGHEHKVMAVVFVDSKPPLCISADNGGDIFIWGITLPFEEKPFRKLNEEKDWRYSGIHALAVSSSGYFYTGSGDKSIKAWSMHDYSLSCTMTGHNSVVSALVVCNEVLYSGSWDGTIRLWCLSDHSPLALLGEEAPGASVLSLSAYTHTLVAAYENGSIKVWYKDKPLNSISAHSSSIFSICMEGQWIFSGGWNKTILVQAMMSLK
uniref:uncharacterized protein LOC122606284 isoform X2 n=1 Tax=Erigeron canadensis TaxID=72917 RepID=UPI001CB93DB9|nr:uncharacterized protein LOC122606284 isoform X2 [Erigeron canadensis]